jgi:hypothetical protein
VQSQQSSSIATPVNRVAMSKPASGSSSSVRVGCCLERQADFPANRFHEAGDDCLKMIRWQLRVNRK